jgi:hypothetical protein
MWCGVQLSETFAEGLQEMMQMSKDAIGLARNPVKQVDILGQLFNSDDQETQDLLFNAQHDASAMEEVRKKVDKMFFPGACGDEASECRGGRGAESFVRVCVARRQAWTPM